MNVTKEIMTFILSGGGVALLGAFGKLAYDWVQGRVMREESAVTQWQGIAQTRLEEIHRKDARLKWFETHYALLWLAYSQLEHEGKKAFPFAPPPPPDDGEEKTNT